MAAELEDKSAKAEALNVAERVLGRVHESRSGVPKVSRRRLPSRD